MVAISPRHDTSEHMSFALEVKFLVAFSPKADGSLGHSSPQARRVPVADFVDTVQDLDEEKRARFWRYAFTHIAKTLGQLPGQRAISKYDVEEQALEERDFWKTHWIVKSSNSAEILEDDPDFGNYLWVPTEINSPKLLWKDPSAFAYVFEVLDALRSSYYCLSNSTCEVHVHIGRWDNAAFSLDSMHRIAVLLWLAEPLMRLVKDPRAPNFSHKYTWSSPLRDYSRLAMRLKEQLQMECSERVRAGGDCPAGAAPKSHERRLAVEHIFATEDHRELGQLMSGEIKKHRRLGFNFSAFGEENATALSKPRTIEARFLESTMAPHVVLSWLRIIGSMIERALDGEQSIGQFWRALIRFAGLADSPTPEKFEELMMVLEIDSSVYAPIRALIRRIHWRPEDLAVHDLAAAVEDLMIENQQQDVCVHTMFY